MRPNQEAKRVVIDELKDKISRAKAFVLVEACLDEVKPLFMGVY